MSLSQKDRVRIVLVSLFVAIFVAASPAHGVSAKKSAAHGQTTEAVQQLPVDGEGHFLF